MKSYDEILKTEYSEEFDKIRKDMVVTSYHKLCLAGCMGINQVG